MHPLETALSALSSSCTASRLLGSHFCSMFRCNPYLGCLPCRAPQACSGVCLTLFHSDTSPDGCCACLRCTLGSAVWPALVSQSISRQDVFCTLYFNHAGPMPALCMYAWHGSGCEVQG